MLKRFMNWLLYQLQKALGAISGQRRGNRLRMGSHVNSAPEAVKSSEEGGAEPIVSSQPTARRDDSASLPSVEPLPMAQPETTVNTSPAVNPATAEPDTHRRLNASAAALPGVETAVPSFPTDVSELLPSSRPAVSPQVSDEQLPVIHDLLPAVENNPQGIAAPEDVAGNDNVEGATTQSSEISDVDDSDVDDSDIDDIALQATAHQAPGVAPTLQAQESLEPPTTVRDLPTGNVDGLPSQAVLCSFDITESDRPVEDSDPSVAEQAHASIQPTTQSFPTSESIELTESVKPSQPEFLTDDVRLEEVPANLVSANVDDGTDDDMAESSTMEPNPAQRIKRPDNSGVNELLSTDHNDVEGDNRLLADDNEPTEAPATIDSIAQSQLDLEPDKAPPASPRQIEPLPYPWSLAVPKQGANSTAAALDQADAVLSAEGMEIQSNGLEPTQAESFAPAESPAESWSSVSVKSSSVTEAPEILSKSGVVKLLFTIKPGNFHGYIVPNDGTQDILFHQKYINSDIFDQLERGAQVMVSVKHIEGKAYATNVDLL